MTKFRYLDILVSWSIKGTCTLATLLLLMNNEYDTRGGEVDDMIGSTRYKVQGPKVVILLLFMYSVLVTA